MRFGTKAALFRCVVDRALVGDSEPVDVADRPRTQEAMTAKTLGQRIDALVDVSTGIAKRAGRLFEVAAHQPCLRRYSPKCGTVNAIAPRSPE